MKYRPDVDGLRALAVLAVVLFHTHEGALTGGFVGVDVFFAISGFLITKLIADQVNAGSFSFRDFYARRIRRLLPAFLPVVVFSFWLSQTYFAAEMAREFKDSVLGAFLYANNFVFLAQADYFDDAAELKPLLHTWSLAIEEQFYLFYPAVLVFITRWRSTAIRTVTVLLTLASFVAAMWAVSADRYEEAFYHSPLRFWELLAGSLLALSPRLSLPSRWNALVRSIGVVLVIVPMFLYSRTTPFPGLSAVPPIVGSLLLLAAAPRADDFGFRVLASSPLKYIGRISYSLYLWHWPLLVAARVAFPGNKWALLAAALASFPIASLSFHFLETPFRVGEVLRGGSRPFVFLFSISALAISAVAYSRWGMEEVTAGKLEMGAYFDWNRTKRAWERPCKNRVGEVSSVSCLDVDAKKPTLLLIGDSQAQHLLPGLYERWPHANIVVLAAGGCKPIRGWTKDRKHCNALREQLFDAFDGWEHVDAAIVSVRQQKGTMPGVLSTAKWLSQKGIETWVVGSFVEYKPALDAIVMSNPGRSIGEYTDLAQDAIVKETVDRGKLLKRSMPDGVNYVDTYEIFCGGDHCKVFDEHGIPLMVGGFHLTAEGSRWFVRQLPLDLPTR